MQINAFRIQKEVMSMKSIKSNTNKTNNLNIIEILHFLVVGGDPFATLLVYDNYIV